MALSITKPTVGGSEDTWGTTINTALDDIVSYANTAPQLGDANVFTAAQTVSADFIVNTNLLFVDVSTSSVGIGTNTPAQDLHVKSSNFTTLLVESDGATHDPVLALKNGNGGASEWTARLDKSDSDKFQLRHNSTDYLTVTTGGNVGIGTSSPGHNLDVQSSGDTTLRVKANSSGAGNDDDAFLRLDAAETGESEIQFYLDGADVGYGINAFFGGNQLNYNVPAGATHDFQVNSTVIGMVSATGLAVTGAVTADNILGQGQTWQDVTGSRASSTEYTNSTDRPIMVCVETTTGTFGRMQVRNTAGSGSWITAGGLPTTGAGAASLIVPPGAGYRCTHDTILAWAELR